MTKKSPVKLLITVISIACGVNAAVTNFYKPPPSGDSVFDLEVMPKPWILEDPPCIPMIEGHDICAGDYVNFFAERDGEKLYGEVQKCFDNDYNDCYNQVRAVRDPAKIEDSMMFQIFPIGMNDLPPVPQSPVFWYSGNSYFVLLRDKTGKWLQTGPQTVSPFKKAKDQYFNYMGAYKYQSAAFPTAEKFILVKPDLMLDAFYLLRTDGSLFWQFGDDTVGELFLFDRPYMPTSDKINMALLHFTSLSVPKPNYEESFTDYYLDVTSGRRELKTPEVVMSAYAENQSAEKQTVSLTWSRTITDSATWTTARDKLVGGGLEFKMGVPGLQSATAGIGAKHERKWTYGNGNGHTNATAMTVANQVAVPPFSAVSAWVTAQQGILDGVSFKISYNRRFSGDFAAKFEMNGTWSVIQYFDVKVCWGQAPMIEGGDHSVKAGSITAVTCAKPEMVETIKE
ncbi:hypothetical protein SmJEL517_g00337 [Synchytrium microbalum]|uniref:Uncharacterized protein n=1 Tax=Synchytrium microbalum TaxID=1806994 RepID=A0A507C931_9FUNG|nr:uncharacterized protein SmJEL517_g00337 [Synchytrium microbalum]TPX38100.1 hypothetical protein SmJEL517_g00337 [Synchytrium microbalum]